MRRYVLALTIAGLAVSNHIYGQNVKDTDRYSGLSGMGSMARRAIAAVNAARAGAGARTTKPVPGTGDCADGNFRCTPIGPIPNGTQSEVSIAVDSTGQNIVIGFNDFRGFSRDPVSLSGYMYSNNGGLTFVDGGQLPSPGDRTVAGLRFPQIYGDPDVKYLGGCNFIYASILVAANANDGIDQTLGIHRSTDCGKTWTGPFEVTPATNPGGSVDPGFSGLDAADKELMDVDPDTGRVLIGWTNFSGVTPFFVQMLTTYTDNILSANPTFAPRRVVSSMDRDGQGASVQFAGQGSPNAYIAWVRSGTGAFTRRIGFARSTDNGATWGAPTEITGNFLVMDQVLGNDRVNENPSIAVDNSTGPYKGTVYAVYSNNNSLDGADVAFRRSTDGGLTFSTASLLNARPGNDRAQWFPFVTVDRQTGRVNVFYFDQGIASSGHLTQVSFQYSDDGGTTWSRPADLEGRSFKAGWGNDTTQPNLGDYNQAVAQQGTLYAAYAVTLPQVFTDGQPSTQMRTPDVAFSKVAATPPRLGLVLGPTTFTDSGGNGFIDENETINLTLPVGNFATNPLYAGMVSGVTAVLSTTTPGVSITQAAGTYGNIAQGGSATNSPAFVLKVAPGFAPGTPIDLVLNVTSVSGVVALRRTLETGTIVKTTLLSEDFESATGGTLPAGWASVHGAGDNTVQWTTNRTFCGASNKAFQPNADNAPPGGSNSRWERLFSPAVTIPGDAGLVEVEFDVCYDTEDFPPFRVYAFDGFFLRVTDLTPGRTLRSVLAEAFEREFTTGPLQHYPKHLPRSSDPNYFEDMSVWAGPSGGYQRVRILLPGMADSRVQFRFEYTQDSIATCADVRPGSVCGVAVDNFVVRSTRAVTQPVVNLIVTQQTTRDTATGQYVSTVTVRNDGTAPAPNVRLTSAQLGSAATITSPLPNLGTMAPGASASAVIRFAASAGAPGGSTVLRVNGAYDGGTFSGSARVTLP
ncbi:MAG TPA: hypothetical protein VER03_09380 [Bryobacteraceae bacterium]|nr:hypothetical protein [Bryobacteraceae bacterium]